MVRKKVFKLVAKYFPLNAVRVWALRRAGYQVGRHVYVGEELQITDDLAPPQRRMYMGSGLAAPDQEPLSRGTLHIGDRVSIAQRVTIILSSYPNWSRLCTEVETVIDGKVEIQSDAWIGAGAIILPNVTVGEQAVVGAGSVVTRDVRPRTVVAGNPAKVLREL